MEERDGAFVVRTLTTDGSVEEYPLVGVIGHTPVRQYLALLPGNRLQAISAIYDVSKDRWIDVFAGENRQPGEWGHWTGQGMNWNAAGAIPLNTARISTLLTTATIPPGCNRALPAPPATAVLKAMWPLHGQGKRSNCPRPCHRKAPLKPALAATPAATS